MPTLGHVCRQLPSRGVIAAAVLGAGQRLVNAPKLGLQRGEFGARIAVGKAPRLWREGGPMKARVRTLVLSTAVSWAFAWHGPAAAQDDAAASGAALTCIARANIDRWLIIDANRILVATRDQKLYRNDLPRACPALRANSQISQTADSQLCAGATFQILIRVSSSGNTTSVTDKATGVSTSVEGPGLIGGPVCALGAFMPIGAEEAAALIAVSKQPPPSRRERRAAREAAE